MRRGGQDTGRVANLRQEKREIIMHELDDILEALEDAQAEIMQLEDQLEWYSSDILMEKLEFAIALCKAKMV